ncbi:MAG: metallophosphoesterase, partial [Balneolales bacterium]
MKKYYAPQVSKSIIKAGIVLIILANLMFAARFMAIELGYYEHQLVQNLIIYPGGISLGALCISFVAVLTIDVVTFMMKALKKPSLSEFSIGPGENPPLSTDPESGRRRFLKTAGLAAVSAPFGITIGTAAATAHDYKIIRKDLFFDNLPAGLDGLKIAQVSDIHSGIYMTQHQIHEIFEITNSLHPNLVTITGDFVDTSRNELPALYNTVRNLKSDYGTYGCLGNHDHYASGPVVSSAMEQRGVKMLVNSNDSLRINGENLTLLGVDDFGSGKHNRARIDHALNNIDQDTFKILLSHRPELFDVAHHQGVDLTL